MSKLDEYTSNLYDVLVTFDTDKFEEFIDDNDGLYPPHVVAGIKAMDKNVKLGMMAKMLLQFKQTKGFTKAIAMTILDDFGWDYKI